MTLPFPFWNVENQTHTFKMAMDLRVGHKYRIGKKIGSGSFGTYHAHFAVPIRPPVLTTLLSTFR